MRIVAFFIFLILLSFIGIGVWNLYAGQAKVKDTIRGTSMITNEKTARDLHELLAEHTALVTVHLGYIYDGRDSRMTKDQLNYNTQKIGEMIETIGTKKDQAAFIKIFNGQIDEYENYTRGLKEKDKRTMNTAKNSLSKDASEFGKMMNKLSPSISSERGEELLLEDIALTLAIVDAHAEKDSGKKMLLIRDASVHANAFADEWSKSVEIEGDL